MRKRYPGAAAVLLACATAAVAADPPVPRISVAGTATVRTMPDLASVSYSVHGEGTTADDAVRMLVDKRARIDRGLAPLAGNAPALGGEVVIREVRGADCENRNYGAPRLSTGACAIVGYVADLQQTVRTRVVDKAPTMVGLIGRLGGSDPRVAGYSLSDDSQARRRATTQAFADARQRAETLAAGAGVRLGQLLDASDGEGSYRPDDIVVTAARSQDVPPPPPPPPPIAIDAKPQPIETQARVGVTYAIAPAG